jgi:ribosomal protein L11 methylase PrmA
VFLTSLPNALRSSCFVGSADAIRTAQADVVLANISAKVIDLIAYDLNRIAGPEGILILSGFLTERPPEQFTPMTETNLGEWSCWICRPRPVDLSRPPSRTVHSLLWY